MNDARRFILQFRSIVETAPLQIYVSALVFSPKSSIVKRLFSYELPNWIERLPSVEEAWPASLLALEGPSSMAVARFVIFSPDGQLLAASYNRQKKVKIWDTFTGALRATLEGYDSKITAMVFLPNGQLLTSTPDNHIVSIWDPITEISRDIFVGQFGLDTTTVLSPDGGLLASSSQKSSTIKLWNPLIGTARGILEGHSDYVRVMTFAPPNGQLLASGSDDRTVKLWDTSTGAYRQTLKGHSGSITAVVFSPPDGRLLASIAAEDDFTIRLWDTSTGALKGKLSGHSNKIFSMLFSPDGQLLVSASIKPTIRLWDSATGASKGIIEGDGHYRIRGLSFSPNGRLLALCFDEIVQLWDPITMVLHGTLESHSDYVGITPFSPDGHLLATRSFDSTVQLWDTVTVASRDKLEGHSDVVEAVIFSPNGHLFASQSRDKTIRLWDSVTGTCQYILNDDSYSMGNGDSYIMAMAFSPDGQLLVSGYYDGTIRFWNVATGTSPVMLKRDKSYVSALVFSPDGQILASGYRDDTIRFWDPVTTASRGLRPRHATWNGIESIAFTTGGQTLATASYGRIKFWNVFACASRGYLMSAKSKVAAMIFSPNSQFLACAHQDSTVEVWDLRRRTRIQKNKLYRGGSFSFNHDGSQLDISGRLVQISSSLNDSAHEQVWSTAPYGMDAMEGWVTHKGRNVLWLPHDRRPGMYNAYATHKNSLVLGGKSGRVTLFRFSDTVAPPCT